MLRGRKRKRRSQAEKPLVKGLFFATFFFHFFLVTCLISVFTSEEVSASIFGDVGLIETPSAEMMADGAFVVTTTRSELIDIHSVSVGITPWLEGSFRYSTDSRKVGYELGVRDRSYSAKIRFLEESDFLPSLAIGVKDLIGTGYWQSEYLVASKSLSFATVNLGLGWGRLGSRQKFDNLLGYAHDGFDIRPSDDGGIGGGLRLGTWFRGDMGIFGGVDLSLESFGLSGFSGLIEFNSDSYERELAEGKIRKLGSVNIGLKYSHPSGLSVTAASHGKSYASLKVSASFNNNLLPIKPIERSLQARELVALKRLPTGLDKKSWFDLALYDLEHSGIRLHSARLAPNSNELTVEVTNISFPLSNDALSTVVDVLRRYAPSRVKFFLIQIREHDQLGPFVEISRFGNPSTVKYLEGREVVGPTHLVDFLYPAIGAEISLSTRVQFMDPDEPLKYQWYLKVSPKIRFSDELFLKSSVGLNLYNTFNLNRTSESVLPHVRSDLNEYLVYGATGIDHLFFDYRESLSPRIHARYYLGILEWMYTGGGFEILYDDFNSRFGASLTLNMVRKRAFNKMFGLANLSTHTAHVSGYYASPFYNLDFGLHIGRYLAGDIGYTFELRKTFDNGFSIGAWVTRTNVSAEDFGEGSFDKGLSLRFPMHLLFGTKTRASYSTSLRPTERDGGRYLTDHMGTIWWDRRGIRSDTLFRTRGRISR